MSRSLLTCGLGLLLLVALVRGEQASAPSRAVLPRTLLTNQSVVELARAGYTEDFLIDLIRQKRTRFDVSNAGLQWLLEQGLGERVIRTMVISNKKEEETAIVPQFSAQPGLGTPTGAFAPAYWAVPFRMSTPPRESASWNTTGGNRNLWYAIPNPPAAQRR